MSVNVKTRPTTGTALSVWSDSGFGDFLLTVKRDTEKTCNQISEKLLFTVGFGISVSPQSVISFVAVQPQLRVYSDHLHGLQLYLGVEAERLSNVTETYSEAEFVLLCGVAILFVRRGACGFAPPLHLARVGRVLDLVTKS